MGTLWTVWLKWGGVVGLFFAAAESLLAVVSGFNLSLAYLLGVVAYDVAAGLAVGVVSMGLAALLRIRLDRSFSDAFVPLAGATVFIYLLDKSIVAAAFRGRPAALGLGALALATVVGTLVSHRLARRLFPMEIGGRALAVGTAAIVVFLVASRYLTRALFPSYFSAGAVATNAFLLVLLLLVFAALRKAAARAWFTRALPPVAFAAGLGAAFLLAGIVWAARRPAQLAPPATQGRLAANEKPNILLISMDTLRADRLSTYGYSRTTSPALSRLAAEGVLYTNAVSPGNWTGPGHASLFTGTLPTTHGIQQFEYGTLGPEHLTIARILAGAGYRTAGIVANSGVLSRQRGFGQGFTFYDDRARRAFGYRPMLDEPSTLFPLASGRIAKPYRSADEINGVAIEWLEHNIEAPFFLFLNYMEMHAPYAPQEPFQDRFPGRRTMLLSRPGEAILRGSRGLTAEEDAHFRALYDGAICSLDTRLDELLQDLKRLGVYERTLIAVTSDHGEFFGEHGRWHHGMGPFQPVHHVPLIVKYPDKRRQGVDDEWVSLVDVVPTVLDAVGIHIPSGVQGQVLPGITHPVIVEGAPTPELARQYGRRLSRGYQAIYEGPWKLVRYSDDAVDLFNIRDDPGEEMNAAADNQERAIAMNGRLESYLASLPHAPPAEPIDPEAMRRLKAAGYID